MGERRRGDRRADARASHSRAIPRKIQIMNHTLFGISHRCIPISRCPDAALHCWVAYPYRPELGPGGRSPLRQKTFAARSRPALTARSTCGVLRSLKRIFANPQRADCASQAAPGGDDRAGSPARAGPATRRQRSTCEHCMGGALHYASGWSGSH